ncbi:MAG TPA: CoA ester lyase [Xanthobacteraceae bacterium]|nr:CoA ester lyase [Xanthobacteraceae bacterium]
MDLLRTLLFVPGNKDRLLDKAPSAGADGLLYDLEDSVPAAERQIAREKVRARLQGPADVPRYVRINGVEDAGPKEVEADLAAVVVPGLAGVVLPKPGSPDEARFVASVLDRCEQQAGLPSCTIEIVPLIESARGVHFCYDILTATPRMASVIIGSAEDADLMTDLGCRWSLSGTELHYARSKVLLEARAAGIKNPMDGVYPRINDIDGLVKDSENARALGYRGKTVIHPNQIAPVNAVFTPSEREIAYAREMLEAYDAAVAQGSGAISFRGKMIDRAMVKTARELVARFS